MVHQPANEGHIADEIWQTQPEAAEGRAQSTCMVCKGLTSIPGSLGRLKRPRRRASPAFSPDEQSDFEATRRAGRCRSHLQGNVQAEEVISRSSRKQARKKNARLLQRWKGPFKSASGFGPLVVAQTEATSWGFKVGSPCLASCVQSHGTEFPHDPGEQSICKLMFRAPIADRPQNPVLSAIGSVEL